MIFEPRGRELLVQVETWFQTWVATFSSTSSKDVSRPKLDDIIIIVVVDIVDIVVVVTVDNVIKSGAKFQEKIWFFKNILQLIFVQEEADHQNFFGIVTPDRKKYFGL